MHSFARIFFHEILLIFLMASKLPTILLVRSQKWNFLLFFLLAITDWLLLLLRFQCKYHWSELLFWYKMNVNCLHYNSMAQITWMVISEYCWVVYKRRLVGKSLENQALCGLLRWYLFSFWPFFCIETEMRTWNGENGIHNFGFRVLCVSRVWIHY